MLKERKIFLSNAACDSSDHLKLIALGRRSSTIHSRTLNKKKFAAALSVMLLIGGVGIASGCDYHNKSYTMAKNATEAPQETFVLSVDGKLVMKRDPNPGQTIYTVQSEMGEILAQDISFEELAEQFPEIYSQVSS